MAIRSILVLRQHSQLVDQSEEVGSKDLRQNRVAKHRSFQHYCQLFRFHDPPNYPTGMCRRRN